MWRLQEILAEVCGLACGLAPAGRRLAGRAHRASCSCGRTSPTAARRSSAVSSSPPTPRTERTPRASPWPASSSRRSRRTSAGTSTSTTCGRRSTSARPASCSRTRPRSASSTSTSRRSSAIFHDAGALLYYDGANLNAVCGISRPGRHGLRHRPHQPAQDVLAAARRRRAGRRADRGSRHPRAVPAGAGGRPRGRRVPARLRPAEDDREGARLLRAVRRVRPLVRVHPRVRARRCARCPRSRCSTPTTCLARLRDVYDLPFDRLCMHEFVLSARNLKRDHGITALDVAKRLMDHGFHPPTIYFPLIVPEALMIEPTETETKETLDEFVEAMRAIAAEAASDPRALKDAPHRRPGAAPRRGQGGEARDRQVRLRRASRLRAGAARGRGARGAEGRVSADQAGDRRARRRARAGARGRRVRGRDRAPGGGHRPGRDSPLLQEVLLERAADEEDFQQAVRRRFAEKGWTRRTLARLEGALAGRPGRRDRRGDPGGAGRRGRARERRSSRFARTAVAPRSCSTSSRGTRRHACGRGYRARRPSSSRTARAA